MIDKCDDCEYSVLIAELMTYLSGLDDFIMKIWANSEIPFTLHGMWDYYFLQEGLKVDTGKKMIYIPYDVINGIYVIYDKDKIRWERI